MMYLMLDLSLSFIEIFILVFNLLKMH